MYLTPPPSGVTAMVHSYVTLLAACHPVFLQRRTFVLFQQLAEAWILCTTRRTITPHYS